MTKPTTSAINTPPENMLDIQHSWRENGPDANNY
jgi:hypothetical protein